MGLFVEQVAAGSCRTQFVADYLGQACAMVALTLSAGRIVVGGGVSHSPGLHAAIGERMLHWLGGYLDDRRILERNFVVEPALGDESGLIGAMLLAERARLDSQLVQ